jgi:hypothetical protein
MAERQTPKPSLNADGPHAGLRPRSGPPVSWYSLGMNMHVEADCAH